MVPSILPKFKTLTASLLFFNGMYGLPTPNKPTLQSPKDAIKRLEAFKAILCEEVEEIEEILYKLSETQEAYEKGEDAMYTSVDALTDIADWLIDISVYCMSEMTRMGMPPEEAFQIVMRSNFTKLGADGKAIIANGKVQKGPNFVAPEPMLKAWIEAGLKDDQ